MCKTVQIFFQKMLDNMRKNKLKIVLEKDVAKKIVQKPGLKSKNTFLKNKITNAFTKKIFAKRWVQKSGLKYKNKPILK